MGENNTTQLANVDKDRQIGSFYTSMSNFEDGQKVANVLSKSTLVPTNYQNNLPNCMIALEIASRARMSPFMVMQNLDIIHGKPSWSSKFIIAIINTSGLFEKLKLVVENKGKSNMSCYAWTKDKETGEELIGTTVTMEMARAEGWVNKKGSKWQTMPELMIKYRAAAFFAREHCPELLMGLYSVDEVETMPDTRNPLDNIPNVDDIQYTDNDFDSEPVAETKPVSEVKKAIQDNKVVEVTATETTSTSGPDF